MSIFDKVRQKALDSQWSTEPYRGFVAGSPTSTFTDIVDLAFDSVNKNYNHAKHSRFDEMYHPYLGALRQKKMYTSLAPSLCISKQNRSCSYYLVPHRAYSTKQSEWLVERDKSYRVRLPRNVIQPRARSEPPEPLSRRCHTLPTSTTRFDNYFLYWKGRACGLDYIAPFLQPTDYRPAEDRRYQRIYWASKFIDITPSCRHAANFMLTAY